MTNKRSRVERGKQQRDPPRGRPTGDAVTEPPLAIADALVPVRRAAEVWQAAAAEIERLQFEYRKRVAELEELQRHANGDVARFSRSDGNRLHTTDEAAQLLRVSKRKIYGLIRSGALRSVRIDGSRRIPADEVSAYIGRLLAAAAEAIKGVEEPPT